jgi:hypothetical protein
VFIMCARINIAGVLVLCPVTFTRAEGSMGVFAHLRCLLSSNYKLICIFEHGEPMLYRLAMCSYFRHRPTRFVDSCRSPVESAHRPRSMISYLDCCRLSNLASPMSSIELCMSRGRSFLLESIQVPFKARRSRQKRERSQSDYHCRCQIIDGGRKPRSLLLWNLFLSPPCGGANLLTLMQAKAVARQIKLLFDSSSDLVAR